MNIWNKIKSLLIIGLGSCHAGTAIKSKKGLLEASIDGNEKTVVKFVEGMGLGQFIDIFGKKIVGYFNKVDGKCDPFSLVLIKFSKKGGKTEANIYDSACLDDFKGWFANRLDQRYSLIADAKSFVILVIYQGKVEDCLKVDFSKPSDGSVPIKRIKTSEAWSMPQGIENLEQEADKKVIALTINDGGADKNVAIFLNTVKNDIHITRKVAHFVRQYTTGAHVSDFESDPAYVKTYYYYNYHLINAHWFFRLSPEHEPSTPVAFEFLQSDTEKKLKTPFGTLDAGLQNGLVKSVEYIPSEAEKRFAHENKPLSKKDIAFTEWY